MPASPPEQRPLIVGIGGSTGAASTTERLLRRCLALAEDLGARTVGIAGDELAALPIYGADVLPSAGATALTEAVRAADGVVVATPGYHGSKSGRVTNALEHLEALRGDARPYLHGRAVGVIVGAAGWQACGTALVSVRSTIHALRGWPTPLGVTVNTAEQRPPGDGSSNTVDAALATLAGQVLDFARWQAAARSARVSGG